MPVKKRKIKCPKCKSNDIDTYDKSDIYSVLSYCNKCGCGFTTNYKLVYVNQEVFDDGLE